MKAIIAFIDKPQCPFNFTSDNIEKIFNYRYPPRNQSLVAINDYEKLYQASTVFNLRTSYIVTVT